MARLGAAHLQSSFCLQRGMHGEGMEGWAKPRPGYELPTIPPHEQPCTYISGARGAGMVQCGALMWVRRTMTWPSGTPADEDDNEPGSSKRHGCRRRMGERQSCRIVLHTDVCACACIPVCIQFVTGHGA